MSVHRSWQHQEQWLNKPLQQDKINLVCFPYAGGSASVFNTLAKQLPEFNVCSVQYPGRDTRLLESRPTQFKAMHNTMAEALIPQLLGHDVILYGHSLGAWLAWVIAQELEQLSQPAVELIVAAQRAPSCRYPYPANQGLKDAEVERVLGVTFAPQINANPQLKRLFLQIIRDDLALCETFQHDMSSITTPVTVISAKQDHIISQVESLAWKKHCKGGFQHHEFDAEHLFIDSHVNELCSLLRNVHVSSLKPLLAQAS